MSALTNRRHLRWFAATALVAAFAVYAAALPEDGRPSGAVQDLASSEVDSARRIGFDDASVNGICALAAQTYSRLWQSDSGVFLACVERQESH